MGAITHYENFARHCLNLSKTVRGYSDANKRIYTDYMRQCGIGSDVEVNVHVETLQQSNRHERKIITFSG